MYLKPARAQPFAFIWRTGHPPCCWAPPPPPPPTPPLRPPWPPAPAGAAVLHGWYGFLRRVRCAAPLWARHLQAGTSSFNTPFSSSPGFSRFIFAPRLVTGARTTFARLAFSPLPESAVRHVCRKFTEEPGLLRTDCGRNANEFPYGFASVCPSTVCKPRADSYSSKIDPLA